MTMTSEYSLNKPDNKLNEFMLKGAQTLYSDGKFEFGDKYLNVVSCTHFCTNHFTFFF